MKTPCVLPGCSLISKFFSSRSNEFELEALEHHNTLRAEHGVGPLKLNKDISKYSQKWAEDLAKRDAMAYSLNQKYGENVYCGWTADPNTKITAKVCIDKWYDEINEFSFGKEPEVLTCGHFTQIVWKNTTDIGVGSAKSKSGKLYVVVNYYPPGNYSGQFCKNVLPPGANQFRREMSNNNLDSSTPSTQRSYKSLNSLPSDLINKFKSTSISSGNLDEEFLNAHNQYRNNHGVPPLELSKKLCKHAHEWAKTIAAKNQSEHSDQHEYGENIFSAWASEANFVVGGRDPVDKWYSEIRNHKFGKEPTDLNSGHFSQVVWESTKQVGVGVAKSKDGTVYVVANYYPPGNVIGSFTENVKPPIK